jgi:hypothetical protein
MKAALCFIISYNHILNKEKLWIDWINTNKDIINVYFHYKNINKIKSNWIKKHAIPEKLIQQTSYYHVVPAYMSILSYAYNHDKENMWFCMLTESCVPIISPDKFRMLFYNYAEKSVIKCYPSYWNVDLHRRANLKYLTKEYHLANEPWFTLTRSHVKKMMLYAIVNQNTYNKINEGGLSNESIFAIILKSYNELTNNYTHINESSTIADWFRMSSPTSPYLFEELNDENYDVICKLLKENKYAMFLRKVNVEFPDDTIKQIMYEDFGHVYVKKRVYWVEYILIAFIAFILAKFMMNS